MSSSLTLTARTRIPAKIGMNIESEIRPPPKIPSLYKDNDGVNDKRVLGMFEKMKKFKEEKEMAETENEISSFEAKLEKKSQKVTVKKIPIPRDIDSDVLRRYEPPSATRFYDYQSPKPRSPSKQKQRHEETQPHSRRCACCHPSEYERVQSRHLPSRPQTAVSRQPNPLPPQFNQSYWNVLDEPSIPKRPKTDLKEIHKPAPFSLMRTGPRPAGIPVVLDDYAQSQRLGEEKFNEEMARKIDKEMSIRERTLKSRAKTSRVSRLQRQMHTLEIAAMSGQKWALQAATPRVQKNQRTSPEVLSKDELEAIEELKRYDDMLYKDYQRKRRPEYYLEQTADGMLIGNED